MDRDRHRRRLLDVRALLGHLGIRATKAGPKWRARCPNPVHDDSDPSWSIIDRPGHKKPGSPYCFACHFAGGPWELASAVWGISVEEAGQRLAKLGLGLAPPPTHTPPVRVKEPAAAPDPFALPKGVVIPGPGGVWYGPALDYLTRRGVTCAQIDRWGLGYAIWGHLRGRVVIPVRDPEGRLLTYAAREFAPGMAKGGRYDSGHARDGAKPRRAIWGEERFDLAVGTVTVCEGAFSGLALERAGAPNPAALLGSELTEEKARILARFPRILVATDPDPAGDTAARWVATLGRRAAVHRVRLDQSPDDEDPEALRRAIDKGRSILY